MKILKPEAAYKFNQIIALLPANENAILINKYCSDELYLMSGDPVTINQRQYKVFHLAEYFSGGGDFVLVLDIGVCQDVQKKDIIFAIEVDSGCTIERGIFYDNEQWQIDRQRQGEQTQLLENWTLKINIT